MKTTNETSHAPRPDEQRVREALANGLIAMSVHMYADSHTGEKNWLREDAIDKLMSAVRPLLAGQVAGGEDNERTLPAVTPIMQTRKGIGGNCLAACLASIFDCPIESIPELATPEIIAGTEKQNRVMREWLRQMGFDYIEVDLSSEGFHWTDGAIPSVPCLLAVKSSTVAVVNKGFGHFVVGALEQDGERVSINVIHDPNGMRKSYEATAIGFFVPIRPRHPARPVSDADAAMRPDHPERAQQKEKSP